MRHGQHDEVGRVLSGRSGIALNAAGRAQAEALAGWFENARPASLHSSPRRRAIDTAMPLAGQLGLAIARAPGLDEIDFGEFAGRSFAALEADPAWQRWNGDRMSARCPGGETMAEAAARAWAYLRTIEAAQTPAVCVTHCDVIRALVAQLLGLGFNAMFSFDCDPASITTIELDDGWARLVTLNAPVRRPAAA